jgi:mono/diheme cytochrome c family protein
MYRLRFALVALLALACATGCGSSSQATPTSTGAHVFTSAGCAGCHTLREARAHGQVGPDLDQLKPSYATVLRQVRRGGNGMPSFRGKLDTSEVEAVARFVATTTASSRVTPVAFRPDATTPAQCHDDFACLRQAYGNIAYRRGPEIALAELDAAQRASPAIAGLCHQITHEIGHAALARYHGNSAQALGHGAMTCWSGYYHGVVERAFAGVPRAQVAAKARQMCGVLSGDAQFVRYQCVHGLGHGLMIYSGGDMRYSLSVCDALSTTWDQQSCTGGVFMQNFLPAMPGMPKLATTMTRKQQRDLIYPCNAVVLRDKLYCYLQITSRILPAVGYDWRRAAQWCRHAEHLWVATCFQSLGRDVSGFTREDVGRIAAICRAAGRYANECDYGAVRDVASNDAGGARAAKLCVLRTALSAERCYSAIGSILGGLAVTAPARRALCDASTPPRYRRACYGGAAA